MANERLNRPVLAASQRNFMRYLNRRMRVASDRAATCVTQLSWHSSAIADLCRGSQATYIDMANNFAGTVLSGFED
jgi:hypothetical protein